MNKKSDSKWLSLATVSILGQPPSEEKAKAAAISVTDYERDINEVKPDLKLIKWGIGLIIAPEVMPLMKSFFA